MKKILLTIAAIATCTMAANAQRLSLYEEFTGENCGPCASTNPGLWTLISASGNASKVIMIKYMVPIPSSGWFYLEDKADADTRSSYYNVPFAPYARMDGKTLDVTKPSPGHPGYLTQAEIDASAAVSTAFTIAAVNTYNATYDSVITNITVTATSPFSPSGANMKLRTALVQTYHFNTSPGTNGEVDYENIVRAMYPNAGGTAAPNSWTLAMVQNYTIRGAIPSFVDKSKGPFMTVWLQNDNDSVVAQTAIGTALPKVPNDFGVTAGAQNLYCVSGASGSITPSLTLTNTGLNSLTSATVLYKIDAGSWVSQAWSGTLAAGGSTNVTFPAVSVGVGAHTIRDSVYFAADQNVANNGTLASFNVASTAGVTMPYHQNFETGGGLPSAWYSVDLNNNGVAWVNGFGTGLAHNASTYMPWYKLGSMTSGETNLLVMPTPTVAGHATLDFYEAYAQQSSGNNDELDVVYSTDCGTTWTNVWSKTGSAHATTSPTTTYWLPSPTAGSSDWQLRSVDLSAVPAGSLVAFKAVAGGGNNLFIDDVSLTNYSVGINTPASAVNKSRIYPNPAKDVATLELTMGTASDVQIEITDVVGHVVNTIANHYNAGEQNITINTSTMPAGLYNVKVITGSTTLTNQLSVVK